MKRPQTLVGFGILTAVLLLVAVACGDDATATPAPTQPPPQAAIDTDLIQSLVVEAIKAAVPAAPEVVTAAQIQSMVETAVAAAAPEGASPAEIQALVETAVAAAAGEGLTSEDVAALVSSAVADAISDQPEPLTAAEIEAIVKAAQPATPTPAPTITPVPTSTPIPTPTQAPKRPVVDRLKVAALVQIETSDPVNAVGENQQNLPMYEALVRYDEQGLLEPMLAESWSVTPDARNWTFNLRQGVQFHKGFGEFTADDVIHTNERHGREGVRDQTYQGFFRDQVTGNQTAPDPYTLVLNLPAARLSVDDDLSSKWHNLILSKAHFDAEGQDGVEGNPIGTNAFQFVSRVTGASVLFERVPYEHYRVTPDFAEVEMLFVSEPASRMALLLTGAAHMTILPPDLETTAVDAGLRLIAANDPTLTLMACLCGQYKEGPTNNRLEENPDLPYSDVFHDATEVPWVNKKVRQALNHAINREEINATLLDGRGIPMYVPNYHPTLRGFNPEWEASFEADYGYDPARARALLAEAEEEIGQPLDFSLTVLASTNKPELPVQVAVSEAIHGYLFDVGVDLAIDSQEYTPPWRPHLFNNTVGGVIWPNASSKFTDPLMLGLLFWSGFVCCHFYESDAIDALYVQLQGDSDQVPLETDLDERHRILQEAGNILYDEYATIPLFWLSTTYIVDPNVVEDYDTGGQLGLRDLEHVKAVQIRR